MTKTYSETRSAILFRAAADFYKLAAEIAADTNPDDENETAATRHWAASVIDSTYAQAQALEKQMFEMGGFTTRQERQLARLRAGVPTTENRRLKASILAKIASP